MAGALRVRASKHLLLWSSLGTLALLGWAAYAENRLQEWRVAQRAYRQALPEDRRAEFAVQLRQVVVPALDVADRCVSCHVGMAAGESGLPGDPLFAAHPDVAHDPGSFGCTVCHGGQGRATSRADAHGDVSHWPGPMIPAADAFAGCGSCHTHLEVPRQDLLERGHALFERHDCLACHRVEERGGTQRPGDAGGMEGPDLSRAGAAGPLPDWHASHLRRLEQELETAAGGPWQSSFAPLPPDERALVDIYLRSRVGAPGLVESKALFHSLGCRGCHPVNGVGGDDGPDLTRMGQRDPGQLDFTGVEGKHTLDGWLREHFRAPGRVVPGSQMPDLALSEEEIDRLTFYMLSLRRTEVPEAFWPADRIRAERFGQREFATDGATLYGTFCAACHGPVGEGMRYPGMPAFPAIAQPAFLAVAGDEFLRQTIAHGRPGRRMPAWADREGGLRPEEIDAVIAHLREMSGVPPPPPDPRPRRWVQADPAAGAPLFAAHCSGCHGPAGGGGEGPALANRALQAAATDTYFYETIRRGRHGTAMPGFSSPSPSRGTLAPDEIESIVAFIRLWEDTP